MTIESAALTAKTRTAEGSQRTVFRRSFRDAVEASEFRRRLLEAASSGQAHRNYLKLFDWQITPSPYPVL